MSEKLVLKTIEAGKDSKNSQEKHVIDDPFKVLDDINFDKVKELKGESSVLEVANEMIQDLKNSELGNLIKEEMNSEEILDLPKNSPSNFNEMLDTSTGNAFQRLSKWYIRIEDSEKAVKIFESIGVDKFRRVAKSVMIKVIGKKVLEDFRNENPDKNTHYFLANTSLNSMIDFAVNKASVNEAIHLVGSAVGVAAVSASVAEGASTGNIIFASGAFLLNLYCVLAQRYTRAELGIIIDRKIKNHADFDAEKYNNTLNIEFPNKSKNF
ncbi:MAG: hypothetical protein WC241_05095 [Candidatus Paceibacterota bacterium]|jgi:hypothetical protein